MRLPVHSSHIPCSELGIPGRSDKCETPGARRAGPGRRRRPEGRSGAKGLDAPEHARKLAVRSDRRVRRLQGYAVVPLVLGSSARMSGMSLPCV